MEGVQLRLYIPPSAFAFVLYFGESSFAEILFAPAKYKLHLGHIVRSSRVIKSQPGIRAGRVWDRTSVLFFGATFFLCVHSSFVFAPRRVNKHVDWQNGAAVEFVLAMRQRDWGWSVRRVRTVIVSDLCGAHKANKADLSIRVVCRRAKCIKPMDFYWRSTAW